MPKHRILWRSWSPLEAQLELDRFKTLPMHNLWLNGHNNKPQTNDIYLTTNGFDHKPGHFRKATLYAESYVYLTNEYNQYERNTTKWDHRFHFNPHYSEQPRSSEQLIGCWWKSEQPMFEEIRQNKKIKHVFGMVLGRKKHGTTDADIGWMRSEVVKHCRDRSFQYYGTDWFKDDPNYRGEAYVNGHRRTPVKFNDARRLMANSKFVFAFENCRHEKYSVNYLTEKIFHGFLSYSVPIYLGCWNVEKLLDPGLYIDLRQFDLSIPRVLDHCEKMSDSEYNGYLDRIAEFINGKGQDFTCDQRFLDLDRKLTKVFGG